MRRLILLAFIGTFLMREITLSKVIHRDSSNQSWLFGSSRLNDNKEGTRIVCESEECKKMADTILKNMNRSINPCDDFYEYVCGRWQEHNPIPKTKSSWSAFDKLQAEVDQQIQEIVEAESEKDDLNSMKLAKKWYKACMDTDSMEKQGIDPLVFTLSRLGGWPMIMEPDEWHEQKYSWQKVDDQYMRLTGRNSFHDVRVQETDDPKVKIDTPHLPLGSKKLRSVIESDSEEEDEEEDEEKDEGKSKNDEDPSNEDEQSDEEHEPGSESEDDSKTDDDNDDDNNDDRDDDDDDDNNDDDDNDDTNEQDKDMKKEISKKKVASKISRRKSQKIRIKSNEDDDDDDDDYNSGDNNDGDNDDNDMNKQDADVKKELGKKESKSGRRRSKKLRHVGQRKSGTRIIKKYGSHKTKRQRIKRSEIPIEVNSKLAQRFIRREKLDAQKNERNHVRKVHGKRTKKILSNGEMTIPQVNEEKETKEMTILEQYADYISKVAHVIAREMYTEISQERLDKDIQNMIQFQLKLIQIVPTDSIFDLEFDLEVTLAGFQEWYDKKHPKTVKSKINWVNKINALFDEAHESVNDDLNLSIISPSYIKGLLSLLDKTSNRTIVNYIHWNFISRIIKTTTSEMTDLYNSWEEVIKGRTSRPRSTICKSELKDILAYEFVRKYFPEEIARTASNMLRDMQKEVEYLIEKSDWLDDKAKDFALAKVKNLKGLIGYPNWYKNTTIIQEYFKGLIFGSSYYENALRYSRYIKLKSLRKLSKKDNEIDEIVDPIEVNAYYMPWKNALIVTAADFQSPFFAYGRPQAINYAMVGLIMAHEVNHGFDNTGHMYDENGDFLGWFSAMAGAYDKKEDCFIEQFNNYPIDTKTNKKIKNYGEQTVGDNIADTMGLQAIFKTYQSKEAESEIPDAALSGMEDFSNDQLFFISFANLWCEAINSSKLMEVANDVHSIGRLRVIGSVSNSDDFATAYNCPVGSPMNPEKKCNIWN